MAQTYQVDDWSSVSTLPFNNAVIVCSSKDTMINITIWMNLLKRMDKMIAFPVSFYMMMIYGLILTAAVFSDQLNVLFHSIAANHEGFTSEQLVPCTSRAFYPARHP